MTTATTNNTTTTLQPALEKHPFLQNLTPDALAEITGCAKNRRFESDEYLTRAGTEADTFFLVRSGQVALLAPSPSAPLMVHTAGPGELVGWSWIIAPYRYRFDARATAPTLVFASDGKCLRQKCEANPSLGYQLLKKISVELGCRMDELQLRLLDVYRGSPHV